MARYTLEEFVQSTRQQDHGEGHPAIVESQSEPTRPADDDSSLPPRLKSGKEIRLAAFNEEEPPNSTNGPAVSSGVAFASESPVDAALNARVATGKATQGDVLLGTLELSRLDEQLITLRQQVRSASADLNRLMNRPVDMPITVPGEL